MPASDAEPNINPCAPEKILSAMDGPELVFGLVGAIGTDLPLVSEILDKHLQKVGYTCDVVRISELMHALNPGLKTVEPGYNRYTAHMAFGTKLREETKRRDACVFLSVAKIREIRKSKNGEPAKPIQNHAYILHSLKNPAEVSTLRRIYGRAFFLIAAYSPRSDRKIHLSDELAQADHDVDRNMFGPRAEELIIIDEEEKNNKSGQQVRDTFAQADVFVDASNRVSLDDSLKRFIEIVFGHPFHTPSIDEMSMFIAFTASLRSADLPRQVGAAIVDLEGSIISVGCNEVPKAGGGAYWPSDKGDRRDFRIGYDSSAVVKQRLLEEAVNRFQKAGWFCAEKSDVPVETLVEEALRTGDSPLMRGARLMDLLEFGRIVHAEMLALTDAGRRGISVSGKILYCTTFPCHMCARHIVASGIDAVKFIEPYPKSMAKDLYPDSLWVEGGPEPTSPNGSGESKKIPFLPFIGVAPNRFVELFRSVRRKDGSGQALEWEAKKAVFRVERFVASYLMIETQVSRQFNELLSSIDIKKLQIRE